MVTSVLGERSDASGPEVEYYGTTHAPGWTAGQSPLETMAMRREPLLAEKDFIDKQMLSAHNV